MTLYTGSPERDVPLDVIIMEIGKYNLTWLDVAEHKRAEPLFIFLAFDVEWFTSFRMYCETVASRAKIPPKMLQDIIGVVEAVLEKYTTISEVYDGTTMKNEHTFQWFHVVDPPVLYFSP